MPTDNDLLDFEETAFQLARFIPEKLSVGEFADYETAYLELERWKSKMILAIVSEELKTATPATYVNTRLGWKRQLLNHEIEGYDPAYHEVRASFRRSEIHRWLKTLGIDIPEALRVTPGQEAPAQTVEADKRRILESFGLLAELYASKHGPDYRHGSKPKASRIVEDMLNAIPNDVTKMGDRKLKEHVSEAIKAWEAKKHR